MAMPTRVVVTDSDNVQFLFVPAGVTPPPEPPPDPPPAPPPVEEPPQTSTNPFTMYMTRNNFPEGQPGKVLWEFRMDRTPQADIPPTPKGIADYGHVAGSHHWSDGDRISYHTGWALWMHSDTHHAHVPALRFQWQDYGATNSILDQGMKENPFGQPSGPPEPKQGLAPYPYERVPAAPVLRQYPGGVIEVFHLRDKENQHLWDIIVPAVEPKNPETRWYYQLNGLFVAVNANFVGPGNVDGVIAKLIVSGLQGAGGPAAAYTYRLKGIQTAGV